MKKTANKCGMNFTFYDYSTKEPKMFVDFINDFTEELSSERTYATGGQNGANLVGFDDAITGTVKVATQIIPIELLAMAAGNGATSGAQLAHREVLTAQNGKITLSNTPVSGSLWVYAADSDCSGEPAAKTASGKEVTVSDAAEGAEYIAYYLEESETAKRVEFKNDNTPSFYIMRGYTKLKDTEGADSLEYVVGYKLQPKRALSLTYHGKGDPISLEMEFDIMEDADGNTYEHTRV